MLRLGRLKDWRQAGTELWSTKHAPKEEAQLIVHKKKLAELREFLRASAEGNGTAPTSKLMLVSGGIPGSPFLSMPRSEQHFLPCSCSPHASEILLVTFVNCKANCGASPLQELP